MEDPNSKLPEAMNVCIKVLLSYSWYQMQIVLVGNEVAQSACVGVFVALFRVLQAYIS